MVTHIEELKTIQQISTREEFQFIRAATVTSKGLSEVCDEERDPSPRSTPLETKEKRK